MALSRRQLRIEATVWTDALRTRRRAATMQLVSSNGTGGAARQGVTLRMACHPGRVGFTTLNSPADEVGNTDTSRLTALVVPCDGIVGLVGNSVLPPA